MITCYSLTAAAAVTTILMPCIWFFGVPLAAASLVASAYLASNYENRGGVIACIVVSALVLLVGLIRADEVNELLRQIARDN